MCTFMSSPTRPIFLATAPAALELLPLAVDVFQHDSALAGPLVQDDAYLLQLSDDVGIPVAGNRLMYQHFYSLKVFVE